MTEEILKEIKIRQEYYKQIEKVIAQSRQFRTVDEYVNFVLKEILFGEEGAKAAEEERMLKNRLRDLGYL
jgi:hypothetical protein